jgi:hypothetical protein
MKREKVDNAGSGGMHLYSWVLGRQRQEGVWEFKVSLSNIGEPVSKKKVRYM